MSLLSESRTLQVAKTTGRSDLGAREHLGFGTAARRLLSSPRTSGCSPRARLSDYPGGFGNNAHDVTRSSVARRGSLSTSFWRPSGPTVIFPAHNGARVALPPNHRFSCSTIHVR